MTTYSSDIVAAGGAPKTNVTGDPVVVVGTFTAATTPLATNDVLVMVPVPPGATVFDVEIAGHLGSAGSITLQIGHTATGGTATTFGTATINTTTQTSQKLTIGVPSILAVSDPTSFSTITLTVSAITSASLGTVLQAIIGYAQAAQPPTQLYSIVQGSQAYNVAVNMIPIGTVASSPPVTSPPTTSPPALPPPLGSPPSPPPPPPSPPPFVNITLTPNGVANVNAFGTVTTTAPMLVTTAWNPADASAGVAIS